jgi:hypothetical protein
VVDAYGSLADALQRAADNGVGAGAGAGGWRRWRAPTGTGRWRTPTRTC